MVGSLVSDPIPYSTLSVVLDKEEDAEQQREALNRSLRSYLIKDNFPLLFICFFGYPPSPFADVGAHYLCSTR